MLCALGHCIAWVPSSNITPQIMDIDASLGSAHMREVAAFVSLLCQLPFGLSGDPRQSGSEYYSSACQDDAPPSLGITPRYISIKLRKYQYLTWHSSGAGTGTVEDSEGFIHGEQSWTLAASLDVYGARLDVLGYVWWLTGHVCLKDVSHGFISRLKGVRVWVTLDVANCLSGMDHPLPAVVAHGKVSCSSDMYLHQSVFVCVCELVFLFVRTRMSWKDRNSRTILKSHDILHVLKSYNAILGLRVRFRVWG
jgi:hypothetical protein